MKKEKKEKEKGRKENAKSHVQQLRQRGIQNSTLQVRWSTWF